MDVRALDDSEGHFGSGLVKSCCGGGPAAGMVELGGGLWRDVNPLGAGGTKWALSPTTGVRQNMKHLLNEFKGMYEEKLRHLGNKDESKETLKMKLRILQSYVNDLGDQNEVLVQTIEDIEKEANEKITNLDNRLRRADQLLNFSTLNLRSISLKKVASPAFHSSIISKRSKILKPHLETKFHLETKDLMGKSFHEELEDVWHDCEQSEVELPLSIEFFVLAVPVT